MSRSLRRCSRSSSRAGDEIALDGVQAILITSANGIRALAQAHEPARCEGLRRRRAIGRSGARVGIFRYRSRVRRCAARSPSRDATCHQRTARLLHAAGAETRGNLAEMLASRGFQRAAKSLRRRCSRIIFPRRCKRRWRKHQSTPPCSFRRARRAFSPTSSRAKICGLLPHTRRTSASARPPPPNCARCLPRNPRCRRPNQEALLALLD